MNTEQEGASMGYKKKEFICNEINEIKSTGLETCRDDEIKSLSIRLRLKVLNGESGFNLLAEAFSLVFQAIKRRLGITPFDVQIQAAISMAKGNIIELPTGEGKTIVAVFVAYFNALAGRGVHVLTFNDFLAKRDALGMKPVYDLLGVSVDYINEHKVKGERKAAYQADITYLTVKEAGYDYLRSFLVYDAADIVQRPFHIAIIDEADSIMIDNARIPLIIAGDTTNKMAMDRHIYDLVATLKENIHYTIDYDSNTISLTDEGYIFFEKEIGGNLYDSESAELLSMIALFLKAEFLLKKDIDYIIKNDEILIIDEFTGRIMKDCKWSDGIQTAVEIKENLSVKQEESVMNRITIQNFLYLYPTICGMTGTALSSASEFKEFYHAMVDVIPPNKPCVRVDHPDIIFSNRELKYNAITRKIMQNHRTGRPVLIGTGNIKESEELAAALKKEGLDIQVLNAKNDEEEAEIIVGAGKWKAITISTNMAGRGVDIPLGGKDGKQYQQVVALGGLLVIGTNRHDSIRIDNQLRGRSGRQGDPGESVFYISLEDPIFMKHRIKEIIPKKHRKGNSEPITNNAVRKTVAYIQKMVEGQYLDAKISLLKYSLLYEQQRLIAHQLRDWVLNDTKIIGKSEYFINEKINTVSSAELSIALKAITLYAINCCWADHLLNMESALDEVPIIGNSTSNSFDFFNQKVIEYFSTFETDIVDKVVDLCKNAIVRDNHIDLEMMGIQPPASTKTYMLLDGTEKINLINDLAAVSNPFTATLYFGYMIFSHFFKRKKRKRQVF
jgi:preprotein translocase subunit SecA